MATIPQPSVVRYSAYPSSSQRAPQLSTGEESGYPDPPPYDECTPDKYTNNQSTLHGGILSAPPPSYASVVSTSATVPVPSATNI